MIYYGESFKKGLSKYKMASKSSNKLLFQKEKKKKDEHIQACLRQFEKKVDKGAQINETHKNKRKVYIEDNFSKDFRDSISRSRA